MMWLLAFVNLHARVSGYLDGLCGQNSFDALHHLVNERDPRPTTPFHRERVQEICSINQLIPAILVWYITHMCRDIECSPQRQTGRSCRSCSRTKETLDSRQPAVKHLITEGLTLLVRIRDVHVRVVVKVRQRLLLGNKASILRMAYRVAHQG